jgi:hypothetical protein
MCVSTPLHYGAAIAGTSTRLSADWSEVASLGAGISAALVSGSRLNESHGAWKPEPIGKACTATAAAASEARILQKETMLRVLYEVGLNEKWKTSCESGKLEMDRSE